MASEKALKKRQLLRKLVTQRHALSAELESRPKFSRSRRDFDTTRLRLGAKSQDETGTKRGFSKVVNFFYRKCMTFRRNFLSGRDVKSHDSCLNPPLSAWATQLALVGNIAAVEVDRPGIEPHTSRTDSNVLTTEQPAVFFVGLSKALKTLEKKAKDPKLKAYCSTYR